MKFIVDAQLPHSLSAFLKYKGYDSIHTLDLPQKNRTTDVEIVQLAIDESRVVVTKDSDFLVSFLLKGKPEKLIIVSTGNISNDALLQVFSSNINEMINLLQQNSVVELSREHLIVRH